MANNIEVTTNSGYEIELTKEESAFIMALRRLEKMPAGRIQLFGSGKLDARLHDGETFYGLYEDCFEFYQISCEGGDGGK